MWNQRGRAAGGVLGRWGWLAAVVGVAIAGCDGGSSGDGPGPDAAGDDGHADCAPAPPEAGEVRARRLACEADVPEGRFVAARPGDVVLENAHARFVVRSGETGWAILGFTGGNLVDAVRLDGQGRQVGVDGLRELMIGAGFHLLEPTAIRIPDDGAEGVARVVVEGELVPFDVVQSLLEFDAPDARLRHEYVLRPEGPVLEVRSRLVSTTGEAEGVTLTEVMLWDGREELFAPGHPLFDPPSSGQIGILGYTPVRAEGNRPPYALAGAEGTRELLNIGTLQGFLDDSPKATSDGTEVVRYVAVGAPGEGVAAPMADVADRRGEELVPVAGEVEGAFPGVAIEARDGDGAPLTRCRTDAEGRFDCRVPPETRALVASWYGDGHGGEAAFGQVGLAGDQRVAVPEGGAEELTLQAPRPATLELDVADAEGEPVAFRLSGKREAVEGDGEDPAAGELERFLHDVDGSASFRLPPGTWDLWVSHGPEWSMWQEGVELPPGETVQRDVTLEHVVDTTHWAAADMHVHAEHSPDSSMPTERRLRTVLAEDLDYLVATDHDFMVDYRPWIEAEGLGDRFVYEQGVEVTTNPFGHFNSWPEPVEPDASGRGPPDWHFADLEELTAELLASDELVRPGLVQCNHPRLNAGYQAFFEVIGLGDDPKAVDAVMCDAVEVINRADSGKVLQLASDVETLLEHGRRVTAVGTSDSHEVGEPVGMGRTLIRLEPGPDGEPRDVPGRFTAEEADAALREGRAVATSGPMLTVEAIAGDGRRAGIGETLAEAGAEVTLRVELQAPAWMPLGQIALRTGASTHLVRSVEGTEVVDGRKRAVIETSLELDGEDAWVIAQHRGGSKVWPVSTLEPWAVTSPVFIDGDGDGRWRAERR